MTEQQIDMAILDFLAGRRETKVARVIVDVANAMQGTDRDDRVEAGIKRLIAAGKLEARGDVSAWHYSEIRLVR